MSDSPLKGRERALEEAFFAQHEEALLRRMREADRNKSQKEAIAAVLPITDDAVLDRLVELGLGPQSAAALGLAPLVFVAWADGAIDPAEREAILQAARGAGLEHQQEVLALLEYWLKNPPSPKLKQAWRDYTQAIITALPAAARADVARRTLDRARAVAEAAGGFLGLSSRISDAEKRVLAELETLLTV
jgi:tellurite resistance protein